MLWKRILSILLVCAIIISIALILRILFFSPKAKVGSLQINSLPKATVFINDKEIGQTPITQEKIPPREYKIKLVTAKNYWETTVPVVSEGLTFVSREIGENTQDSAGQILTVEKIPVTDKCEAVIVADPVEAVLSIDGLEKGKATAIFKDLYCGERALVVSAPGYSSQIISSKLTAGFRLNAIVKLRQANYLPPRDIPLASSSAITVPIASQSATVLDTPTGFLRVRSASSSSAIEIGRIDAGKTVEILEKGVDWVKIKFKETEGWVAANYLNLQ